MQLTIGKKLGGGFAAIILLMVVSSALAYFQVESLDNRITDLVEGDFPTVRAVDEMLNGLNGTLAALRGFLVLGQDPKHAQFFKEERAGSWQDVDRSMLRITEAYANTSDSEDRNDDSVVQSNLEALRKAQAAVPRSMLIRDALHKMSRFND